MYDFVNWIFEGRKKRFLKSFGNLKIRGSNTIRLPGDLKGISARQYKNLKNDHGFKDIRDYRTKLINVGFQKVSFGNSDEMRYDYKKIFQCREMYRKREWVVKINLAELDLSELNNIAEQLGPRIDLYDLISFLMIIGQNNKNGSVKNLENETPKMYS